MKTMFVLIVSLIIFILLYFIYLSIKSHSGTAPGLINQKLSPCPGTPNCINSEFENDAAHFIDTLPYQNKSILEINLLIKDAIQKTGGHIAIANNDYIAATYSSKLFRYIDDVEVRIDEEHKAIHFRSASRVGRSDFGANIKRIGLIKNELEKNLH